MVMVTPGSGALVIQHLPSYHCCASRHNRVRRNTGLDGISAAVEEGSRDPTVDATEVSIRGATVLGSGGITGACETTILTEVPCTTEVPAAGFWLIMLPGRTNVLVCSAIAPTVRFRPMSAAVAAAWARYNYVRRNHVQRIGLNRAAASVRHGNGHLEITGDWIDPGDAAGLLYRHPRGSGSPGSRLKAVCFWEPQNATPSLV